MSATNQTTPILETGQSSLVAFLQCGDPHVSAMLERAERLRPQLLAKVGLLGGEDLHALAEQLLDADARENCEAARDLLDADGLASEAARDLYMPHINTAYLLGLVMGWHAAKLAGGVR